MRALCGAIITAGALIGLGLTTLGYGQRYAALQDEASRSQPIHMRISQVDGALLFVLIFLTCVAVVGLGISFLGLAYHHHRREREHLLHRYRAGLK